MAKDNSELAAKRAEIAKLQASATRKVQRLGRNGVQLAGTRYDPRKAPTAVNRLNTKQADAQLNRLRTFVSRETQFVQYGDGQIDRAGKGTLWDSYKRLGRTYNGRVNRAYKKVENVKLPSAYDDKGKVVQPNNTIGRRFNTVVGDKRSKRRATTNAVYDPPKREATAITSRKALKALEADMRAKVMNRRDEKNAELGQQNFAKMNNIVKDIDLEAMIAALTPNQFAVLWNYTTFADDVGLTYIQLKKKLDENSGSTGQDEDFSSALDIAKKAALWAKKLKD